MPREGQRTEYRITVRAHFSMTKAQLRDKVKSWLELHAHTSVGHGFDLLEIEELGEDDV